MAAVPENTAYVLSIAALPIAEVLSGTTEPAITVSISLLTRRSNRKIHVPKLRAADVQRTFLRILICVGTALGFGIAIRGASITAGFRRVPTSPVDSATSSINTWSICVTHAGGQIAGSKRR